jgi:hypothetical protein
MMPKDAQGNLMKNFTNFKEETEGRKLICLPA